MNIAIKLCIRDSKKDDNTEKKIGKTVLEVNNLSAPGFENISFDLHEGEILGITGQLGSGRTELSLACLLYTSRCVEETEMDQNRSYDLCSRK